MAMRTDRTYLDTDISFFMDEVAERGGVVVQSSATAGSGSAMDQAQQMATYAATPSGLRPLGILTCDVRDNDLTRMHPNWHQEEVQKGTKVTIMKKGTVVTDKIYPGQTVVAGETAYVGHSGLLSNVAVGVSPGEVSGMKVGRFSSAKDEDGFAKVDINLPL